MVNYYELLNIPRDAQRLVIVEAIKKTRRIWNNRSNSPDSAIRAEAEQHVREVAEAERILLDDAKRAEYDRELLNNPDRGPQDAPSDSIEDWEDEFFRFYNRDMFEPAAEVAREALNKNSKSGRAWFLYGSALHWGGNYEAGIDALQRASAYMTDSDAVFHQLGCAYYNDEQYGHALNAFGKAARLDPHEAKYPYLCAKCLRMMGRLGDAIHESETAFSIDPSNSNVRAEYFQDLKEDIYEAMSYNRSSGKHLITNKVQLDYVNEALQKMARVIPESGDRSEYTSTMDEIARLVVEAETKKGLFGKPGYENNYKISNEETRRSGRH